jgi:hypothetical protein
MKFVPLTQEQSNILMRCVLAENSPQAKDLKLEKMPPLSEIVRRRVEVMKLPIKFTTAAYLAVNAFCDRPGAAVILLVDCLHKYEGQTVDVSKLVEVYPDGFYSEEAFIRRIDVEIPKDQKWGYVYELKPNTLEKVFVL